LFFVYSYFAHTGNSENFTQKSQPNLNLEEHMSNFIFASKFACRLISDLVPYRINPYVYQRISENVTFPLGSAEKNTARETGGSSRLTNH